MGVKSGKDAFLYKKFLEEVQDVFLINGDTGKKKKALRWRGKTFLTGSKVQVFRRIKNEIK